MTLRFTSRMRALPVLVVSILLTCLLGTAGWAEEAPQPADLEISSLSPEQYRTGDSLTVGVTGKNLHPQNDWTAETFLQPTPLDSAWDVENFLSGAGFPGWRISVDTIKVKEGGSARWKIGSEQMPWPDSQTTGARGITVRLTQGDTVLEARSLLFYTPLEDLPKTRLNLLLSDTDSISGKATTALAKKAGVTVAVAASTSTGPSRSNHLDTFNRERTELVALPAAGADPSALAETQLRGLLDLALESRGDLEKEVSKDTTVLTDVVLASPEGFTIGALAQLQGNTVIAPETWGDQSRWEQSITPTSRIQIDTRNGIPSSLGSPYSLTIIDPWLPAQELLNAPAGSASTELLIRQQLRTLGMLVGLEDPADQRSLFVDVAAPGDLTDSQLLGRVDALLDNQWIEPSSLSRLVDSEPSEIARPAVPNQDGTLREYREQLEPLESEYALATTVDRAASGPSQLTELDEVVLAPTNPALTTAERAEEVTAALLALQPISRPLSVAPLSTVNVLHQDANFPISVINSGSQELTVNVGLYPSDPRLQAANTVRVTIPAGGQAEVQVPVRAVGRGDVTAHVELITISGQKIVTSEEVTVRVRPNWEDIGTVIVVVLVLTLFVLGLVRSVRAGQRRNPEEAQDNSGQGWPIIDSDSTSQVRAGE